MKTFAICVMAAVAFGLTGCINTSSIQGVNGSGQITSETRPVAGFDQVSVSGSGMLTVVQGDSEGLTIETDDNLLPLIESKVANGELGIGSRNVNLHPSKSIQYHLKVKNLKALHLSGSIHAEMESLTSGQLGLHISGSGKIRIARLEARELDLHISGSGNTEVAGQVNDQHISISGSGNCRAADLKSKVASVNISGSGDASVWVSDALSAHVSGSGRVDYYGNPTVNKAVMGSGRIASLGSK